MKTITISGLDGSGKSTQIKMLQDELERNGSKVFYFHAIEFSLAQKISDFKNKNCLICKILGRCKTNTKKNRSVTKANFIQIFLRKVFLRIDVWRFNLLRNKLRNKHFDYILSDRYFYDSIINIAFLENQKNNNITKTLEGALYLNKKSSLLKPDLAIYLQTTPSLIMSRDRIPDQGLQYLIDKKAIYDESAKNFAMQIIDGNRNREEIQKNIINLL